MTDLTGPHLLRPDHLVDDFRCGTPNLDQWLVRRALPNQISGSSRTWVATVGDHVVGYCASSTAVIIRAEATRRAARNQPDPLPAVLLGRLAVDTRHQSRGIGAALLKDFLLKSLEVAQITGVRLVLVHAKDARAATFYAKYGFEPSPVDELTMMLLVQDLTAAPPPPHDT